MGTMDGLFDGADNDYYPAWVCIDCGNKYGRGYPDGHCCTVHNGTCGLCGQTKPVTEPRDFGHLKQGWREQYEREASNADMTGGEPAGRKP